MGYRYPAAMSRRMNVRLSHLTALATLVALLGAMFVEMGQASAHNVGECVFDPEFLTKARCEAEAGAETFDHDDDANTAAIDAWKSAGHTADSHPATLSITFLDTDGVVSAGTNVTAVVTSSGILASTTSVDSVPDGGVADPGTLTLEFVHVSGEIDHPSQEDLELDATDADYDDGSVASETFNIIVPAGTTPGEYTVSTEIKDVIDYDGDAIRSKKASAVLTVGDPGTGLASATLALGNRVNDDTATVTDESRPESGTDVADGPFADNGFEASTNKAGINLVVSALNSQGQKSNNGDVGQITVIAPGGQITIHPPVDRNADGTPNPVTAGGTRGPNSASVSEATPATDVEEVRQAIHVTVEKANGEPGTVDVYAILTGNGAAVTETITLSFTGDASSLVLGSASGTMHNQKVETIVDGEDTDHRDTVSLALSATDAGGNELTTSIPSVNIRITGPDGKVVGTTRMSRSQGASAAGTPKAKITLSSLGSAAAPLKSGEYTVSVSEGGNSAEGSFTVVGKSANLDIGLDSADSTSPGTLIKATAMVTDSAGNPVADGTAVMFVSVGSLELKGIGETDGVVSAKTKAGSATARYVVSKGSGVATIVAESGDASGTAIVGEPEDTAMPEEEASVSCLSELSGFATWSCGVEADASEIFDMVSGRGVTALHLWNGSTWVRYSVVDGAMVPGSSDFMVTENDILYISN